MSFSSLTHLSVVAALVSVAGALDPTPSFNVSNPEPAICHSYGVDFIDGGRYFINSLSNESFTCVSTFAGCNPGFAEVLLVDPEGDEVLCSTILTTPDGAPALSTCPVKKNQMASGEHMVLIFGNNGDGQPFAWQRGEFTIQLLFSMRLTWNRSLPRHCPSSHIHAHAYGHL